MNEYDTLEKPDGMNKFADIVWIIELAFLAFIFTVIIYVFLRENSDAFAPAILLTAVLGAAFFALIKLSRRFSRFAPVLLILLAAALQISCALMIDTKPISDFAALYNSAAAAANGDYSWLEYDYFKWWAYQIPFVMYESLILRVAPCMTALKLMNAFFAVGSIWLIFKISELYLPREKALITAYLYMLCPASFIITSVLTNQHISLFFFLFGIYLYLCSMQKSQSAKLWGSAAAGVILAAGNLMRPEGIVIILSVVFCSLLYYCFRSKDKSRNVLALALLVLSYFLTQFIVGQTLSLCGVAPYGIGNRVPQWKFVLGLDFIHGGVYSDSNLYILNIADNAERNRETINIIRRSIEEGMSVKDFLLQKINVFWNGMEPLYFAFPNAGEGSTVLGIPYVLFIEHFQRYERAYRLLIYVSVLASAVKMFIGRKNETAYAYRLCATIVCVIFVVFLLVEVQPRYRYITNPFIVILLGSLLFDPQPKGTLEKR